MNVLLIIGSTQGIDLVQAGDSLTSGSCVDHVDVEVLPLVHLGVVPFSVFRVGKNFDIWSNLLSIVLGQESTFRI